MKVRTSISDIPRTSNGNKPKNPIHASIIFTRPSKRILKQSKKIRNIRETHSNILRNSPIPSTSTGVGEHNVMKIRRYFSRMSRNR